MSRIVITAAVVVGLSALAQTVTIGGTGGVEVKKANGETVTVGNQAGTVQVKSKKGTTTVKQSDVTTTAADGSSVSVKNDGRNVNIRGTGTGAPPPPASGASSATATIAAQNGEWSVMDNGQVLEHTCVEGEEVGVLGNMNAITLHGPCRKLSVSGNQNKVTADVVGAIDALGNQNAVSWRAALKGTTPKVSSLGTGNAVSQLR